MFDDHFTMTIDGAPVDGEQTIDVVNPATGLAFAQVPDCTAAQLDAAVAAARQAQRSWRGKALEERQALLLAVADRLAQGADDMQRLLTAEQGKPVADASSEIAGAVYWCRSIAGMELPIVVNEDSAERYSETRHVPIGVVGAIVPWNFPILLGMWKIAPALLAGNSLVVKPSPFTPLTMLRLGEMMRDVLPTGVLNVLSGGDALGPAMTCHPGIDKISFTGSTATGKRVMQSAADTLKRVTLELGGNDPAIIMPDVDIGAVAAQIFWAAFQNSGQICIAVKRIYVHDAIYDRFLAALSSLARQVRIGNGSEQGVQLGPLQNRQQFERVKDLIADSRACGHALLSGGTLPEGAGYFLPVTLVDNPPDDSRVVREEAFGPLLPILRFTDIEDVIRRANDSDYGLASSVWSGNADAAANIAARLESGTVWVNEAQHVTPFTTFGGHKQSGIGVENGLDGLLEYTQAQTISIRRTCA